MKMLPIYVINLDRRPDRMASMATQLKRIGLPFERIPAVDARCLSVSGKAPIVKAPIMDFGAVACSLSHAKALRTFLGSPHSAALILEDDAELAADVPALCASTDWWPAGTSLIKLDAPANLKKLQGWSRGRTPSRLGPKHSRDLCTIVRWNGGAAAYLVDREAAHVLVEAIERLDFPNDRVQFEPRVSAAARRLRPLQLVPAAVTQGHKQLGSDLSQLRLPSSQRWRRHRRRLALLRKRSVLWMVLVLWWRVTGRATRMWVPYSDKPPG